MFEELLSRRGLSFDRLRALVEVAHAGSIAKAADGDPNRQSQYSRQLKELEEYFATELTERQGKNLKITAKGLRLAQIARQTLYSLSDFDAEAKDRPITVTFGAGDNLLQWLVLPRLGAIQKKLGNVQVLLRNCRTKDIVSGLSDLSLDLGLVRETGMVPRLKKVRVFKLTYSIFVPRKLLGSTDKVEARWVLENLPVAFQGSADDFQKTIEEEAQRLKMKLNVRVCCESFPQVFRAVLSGSYAGILPSSAAAELNEESFARVSAAILSKGQERTICLAWNPRLIQTRPEFEKIKNCFAEHLSKA